MNGKKSVCVAKNRKQLNKHIHDNEKKISRVSSNEADSELHIECCAKEETSFMLHHKIPITFSDFIEFTLPSVPSPDSRLTSCFLFPLILFLLLLL